MKISSFVLLVISLAIILLIAPSDVKAVETIKLIPTDNHHIMELNSNQPYVAGFDVYTPDLETFKGATRATAITVSFPSTNTSHFPSGSWLGGGMFVQGQGSHLKFVDYAFYTMLVLDAAGNLFLDVGMHQTGEEASLHRPTEQLVYAYTWRVLGIDPATPITLCARLDLEGCVHYSVSASGSNVTLPPISVTDFPGCEAILRWFYVGNRIVGPFPFSRYVQYFQFGVVSSTSISNNYWSVDLKNPRLLKYNKNEWELVENAWSIEGDISYLDWSWMWGGCLYHGVSAQYYQNPLENPYEVVFFYNGQTLPSGTVLWQNENPNFTINTTDFSDSSRLLSEVFGTRALFLLIWISMILGIPDKMHNVWDLKHENQQKDKSSRAR
ncbi:MAG: hypothetical protein OEX77_00220 [Candidatus Bathyarchaeota archaeon]|nr:hypothetical protein [Candidatus Bathyarchaeota archaeon]MDH5732237.1 hypothetical protein [Candidatus Bathyarchaeota archaeon]